MSKEMFIDVLPEGMAGEIVDCPDCQRTGFQRYAICYGHAYMHQDAATLRHAADLLDGDQVNNNNNNMEDN